MLQSIVSCSRHLDEIQQLKIITMVASSSAAMLAGTALIVGSGAVSLRTSAGGG
jgi:hypothetical protein